MTPFPLLIRMVATTSRQLALSIYRSYIHGRRLRVGPRQARGERRQARNRLRLCHGSISGAFAEWEDRRREYGETRLVAVREAVGSPDRRLHLARCEPQDHVSEASEP